MKLRTSVVVSVEDLTFESDRSQARGFVRLWSVRSESLYAQALDFSRLLELMEVLKELPGPVADRRAGREVTAKVAEGVLWERWWSQR